MWPTLPIPILSAIGGLDPEALDSLHFISKNDHCGTFALDARDLELVDGELVGFDSVFHQPPRASDGVPDYERDQQCI